MIIYKDPLFNFTEIFNEKNGLLIRTNILDENGKETNREPSMRSFPELIDIGIMGKCHVSNKFCRNFGVDCYQSTNFFEGNMKLSDYKSIIDQAKGKTLQIALGGKGDPNKHENFAEILKYTRENNIIPNLTTTGINITQNEIKLIKKYCGAVAISMYSKLKEENGKMVEDNIETIESINHLVEEGIITNIHYVISKKTIDDAVYRLENNKFPPGINAIIFLLYKPVGLANEQNVIRFNDWRLKHFFDILNNKKYHFKIGFDTCFSPLISKHIKNYDKKTIEYCEASRFSCYISPNMKLYPCSFIQEEKYAIDLRSNDIKTSWFNNIFLDFRKSKKIKCCNCNDVNDCDGGCIAGLNQISCGIKDVAKL